MCVCVSIFLYIVSKFVRDIGTVQKPHQSTPLIERQRKVMALQRVFSQVYFKIFYYARFLAINKVMGVNYLHLEN